MKQEAILTDDADAKQRTIVVGDVLRCLSAIAEMQHDAHVGGDAAFSDAIRVFADALKPHRSRPVSDLVELLASLTAGEAPAQRKPLVELPPDLTMLPESEVERVLDESRYLKSQLAELGFQRFGIPRSRLCRLTKRAAVEAIRGALEHERSLAAIGQQARMAAKRRSRAA